MHIYIHAVHLNEHKGYFCVATLMILGLNVGIMLPVSDADWGKLGNALHEYALAHALLVAASCCGAWLTWRALFLSVATCRWLFLAFCCLGAYPCVSVLKSLDPTASIGHVFITTASYLCAVAVAETLTNHKAGRRS